MLTVDTTVKGAISGAKYNRDKDGGGIDITGYALEVVFKKNPAPGTQFQVFFQNHADYCKAYSGCCCQRYEDFSCFHFSSQ